MNWKVLTEYPDKDLEAKWNEFLLNATLPTHYTTPNFMVDPFIRGGKRFVVVASDDDNAVTGIFTGVYDGKSIRSGMAVRPQVTIRQDANVLETAIALYQGMREIGGKKLDFIEFYTWLPRKEFLQMGFQMEECEGDNSIVMLDLSKGADELFKGFSQTRRNELRKAMKKNDLEVKMLETEEELKELYAIHLDWNKRKKNPPDTFEQFKFAHSQKDYRRTFIAKYEGKVIAGSYYRFCKGGVIEYAANNSLVEYQKLRPNDLIGWRSIEWACEQGFTHYSMGGSHLFLRRFGGELVHTQRYKMDMSFLHVHDMKEGIIKFGLKTYRNLPPSVKSKLKNIAGKK